MHDDNLELTKLAEQLESFIKYGSKKEIKQLIDAHPAIINMAGDALREAVSQNDLETVKLLIEHNVNVNHEFVCKGDRQQKGFSRTALYYAVERGNFSISKLLIENGATAFSSLDASGGELLELAVINQETIPLVQLLIDKGAKFTSEQDGAGALMSAIWVGEEMMKLLLSCGTNINSKDKNGTTAIHLAASLGNLEMVNFLIKHGADVNAKDDKGNSALHLTSDIAIVESLLTHGAYINCYNKYGRTALHVAAYRGYTDMAKRLIDAGEDLNLLDQNGCTPLQLTGQSYSNNKTIKHLVKAGAYVNVQNQNGNTVLHLLALVSRLTLEMMTLFIKARAFTNIKNNEAKTPVDILKPWHLNKDGLHKLAMLGTLEMPLEKNSPLDDAEGIWKNNFLKQINFLSIEDENTRIEAMKTHSFWVKKAPETNKINLDEAIRFKTTWNDYNKEEENIIIGSP